VRVRSPQDLVGGIALILLALLAWSQIGELKVGTAARMGPGYFPAALSILVGLFGLVLVARSLAADGPALERWHLRRMIPVLGAIILFAFAIRPLGLVISAVGLVLLASAAAPDLRWRDSLIFGVALVVFSVLVFPVALGLPLPVWPRL